ncbi:TlpA family protein disulfide reductase [Paenibacillus sp.]|uniref:TlpA family protein disulfide reductase n=1 Tax=Paenibacillus sp. TaxID=58172 RepID=UPI002D4417E6|nr:redoxin domain-containing protein [Paenibacillus sp.]HZG56594.1 redoxin domain-containing protein [Paenibacillus sp.]
MRKTWAALGLVVALAAIAIVQQLAAAQTVATPTEVAPKIGYLAPTFELETIEGGRLGIQRGEREKPVIVNFWASWCDPCRLEAPILSALYEKYGDRVDIYGVNGIDTDDMASVRAFIELYEYKFPTLLDRKGEVYDLYRVMGYPTSYFIDRDGVVRDMIVGLPGHAEFERRLVKLIDR